MGKVSLWGSQGILGVITGSLERRLVGALLLIVVSTIALQFSSNHRADLLRQQGETMRVADASAEQARQLNDAVSQLRLATHLYLSQGATDDRLGAVDELTNAAMRVDGILNALTINGMPLYAMPGYAAAFGDLDRHVGTITATGEQPGSTQAPGGIERRNQDMSVAAAAILRKAQLDRDIAQQRLENSTRAWHLHVVASGLVTVVLVLLILVDLLTNSLPALRRMHATVRRLAAGDLEFEIETFRLRELQALSGPLETFRRNARAVRNLAFTDPSTGLLNRRGFVERAGGLLADAAHRAGPGYVILLADIDRFKHVNDDFGHAAGDQLVRLIGERMQAELGDDTIVARAGGDEFAICAPLGADADAREIAGRVVGAVRRPFNHDDFSVAVTLSAGYVEVSGQAPAPQDPLEIGAIINAADLALYAAKKGGRNCAVAYAPEMLAEREVDRALERDLAEAAAKGQLRMVYQPIHPIAGGRDEVEALVRWEHPVLGEIPPSRFIPAAERSGIMHTLGSWIIEQALADLTAWPRLTMSINLSAIQLQQEGFVGLLIDCCRRNRIVAQRVVLEVTESLSIERNTRALLTLELLRSAGFRIALDDFGTGYSSLCMMKNFRFDRLKLDRSLIGDLSHDHASRAVFDAAVTMALRLGAEVVAEGISEASLIEPVRQAGCTHLQGFHYSRPIEAGDVAAYFAGGAETNREVA